MLRSLALLLLAAPFAPAAPVSQAVKNDDELAILGTWKMTVRSHFARADTSVPREILWRLEAEGRGALVDGSVTEFKFELRPAESPKAPKSFDYTMTTGTLAGVYKLDGVERAGDPSQSVALYDWSAGYFNRNTNWLWSALAGFLEDGTPVGANFAALVNESFYPENAFWIGGERTRLPRVIFQYDPEDPAKGDWRIYTEDGTVDLRFHPLGERSEKTWMPFVKVNFRQFMGDYTGKLGWAPA